MITTPQLGRTTTEAVGSWPARHWKPGVVALVFAALVFPVSYTVADPDIWGHVRFGQDLLATGVISHVDVYSYTGGQQPWINHELLAEVAFGAVYNQLGATGLVALKTLVVMLTLALVFWYGCRAGLGVLPAGILTILTAALVLPNAIMVRPHIFTYLFFTVTVIVLNEADTGRVKLLWVLPPLFALWINTHGGVLAGVAMLMVWVGVRVILLTLVPRRGTKRATRAAWPICAALATSIAALLVNPYGHQLIWFLVRTGAIARPEITEWNAVRIMSFEGLSYIVFLVVMTAAIVSNRRRLRATTVALLAVTVGLPLLAQRHLPLFGLTFAILGAASFGVAWGRFSATHGSSSELAVGSWHTRVVWLLALILCIISLPHFRGILVDTKRFPMPVRAVALIQRSGIHANLAVLFDWGEYVIWHAGPRVRVSVDGRRETVYGTATYQQNLDFMRGTGRWDAVLAEFDTNMALVRQNSASANLLRQCADWELVYADRLCALFAKRNTAQLRALRQVSPPAVSPYGEGLVFPVNFTDSDAHSCGLKQVVGGSPERLAGY